MSVQMCPHSIETQVVQIILNFIWCPELNSGVQANPKSTRDLLWETKRQDYDFENSGMVILCWELLIHLTAIYELLSEEGVIDGLF